MKKKSYDITYSSDTFGMSTSLLCAVHCGIAPFLFSLSAISGHSLFHGVIDFFFISIGILLATISFWSGYKKHHRKLSPLIIGSIALLFLLFGKFFFPFTNNVLMIVGGILLFLAHFLNMKLCKKCKLCND